jgi:hypothetical protein
MRFVFLLLLIPTKAPSLEVGQNQLISIKGRGGVAMDFLADPYEL